MATHQQVDDPMCLRERTCTCTREHNYVNRETNVLELNKVKYGSEVSDPGHRHNHKVEHGHIGLARTLVDRVPSF